MTIHCQIRQKKGIKKGLIPKNKAFYRAHEWIRTTTLIKAPPPQDGHVQEKVSAID